MRSSRRAPHVRHPQRRRRFIPPSHYTRSVFDRRRHPCRVHELVTTLYALGQSESALSEAEPPCEIAPNCYPLVLQWALPLAELGWLEEARSICKDSMVRQWSDAHGLCLSTWAMEFLGDKLTTFAASMDFKHGHNIKKAHPSRQHDLFPGRHSPILSERWTPMPFWIPPGLPGYRLYRDPSRHPPQSVSTASSADRCDLSASVVRTDCYLVLQSRVSGFRSLRYGRTNPEAVVSSLHECWRPNARNRL